MKTGALHLIVALPAEARPLRRALGLPRMQPDGDFPLYADGTLRLVITGVGARHVADAVAWLARRSPADDAAWLNLGIAGAADIALGGILAIDEVVDDASAQRRALQAPAGLPVTQLRSVARPLDDYPDQGLVDMEGAPFAAAVARHAPNAACHVVKVVSDNRAHPARHIDGKRCESLMRGLLPWLRGWIAAR